MKNKNPISNSLIERRKDLQNWLRRCLIGPFSGNSEEILPVQPSKYYACGYLSGQWPDGEKPEADNGLIEDSTDSNFTVGDDNDKSDDAEGTIKSCRYRPPSALGLSFFVSKDIKINVNLKGARYKKPSPEESKKEVWVRRQLPCNGKFECIPITPSLNNQEFEQEYRVLEDKELEGISNVSLMDDKYKSSSKLHTRWRPYRSGKYDGYILTISLVNTAVCKNADYKDWEHTHLFHVYFECEKQQGEVYPYPRSEICDNHDDLEEKQLELLYSDKKIYAIGHSVSPNWTFEPSSTTSIKEIKADFMPSCEVPLMRFSIDGLDKETFKLGNLAKTADNMDNTQKLLKAFMSSYKDWFDKLEEKKKALSKDEQEAADLLISKIKDNYERILDGIKVLHDNSKAAKAFSLSHKAMFDYMKAWGQISGRNIENPSWRPFQLAFILLNLRSLIDQDSKDRDIVDLLWFQTGGGKTEAYLAIIAFLICYRRMAYPGESGGTAVIMRYTLRLLTIQQFQRASILICALELIRRSDVETLGNEPITTGLWVGSASSPNDYKNALEIVRNARSSNAGLEKLVVTECPWCSDKFTAEKNFRVGQDKFFFKCVNPECDFGKSDNPILPVNVVDEQLYETPPTLLFATVDKFAMFAWKERAGRFLGNVENCKPPDLIIQDELHLISSELGSIAGLYEAAFDTVLNIKGCHPKYIASTATIRNAEKQVEKLYSRKVNIFPPPGLNWSDSFFARTDTDSPGRLYIGYHSPFISRNLSFAPLAASLMIAPPIWDSDDEKTTDAWWTLVAYHGSLKGLGITQTLMGDEVQNFIRLHVSHILETKEPDREGLIIFERFKESFKSDDEQKVFDKFIQWRRINDENGIVQLTSNRTPIEIRRYLDDLDIAFTRDGNRAIAGVLCTNMFSVGLDISRLGIMVVNGQPFTTGEYIQASSRVGRSDAPGIVVAHYFRNNSRDLSHFENFRAYHESFYRFVEPTSLTPFSIPAIKRALHAALVIVIRHACGLSSNNQANLFNIDTDKIKTALETLKQRCIKASPEHESDIILYMDELANEWKENCGGRFEQLTYERRNKSTPLMIKHGEVLSNSPGQVPWETMQSMRQVDDECGIRFVSPTRRRGAEHD